MKHVVIGAGPGGLVCAKELIEQGVKEVVCLEQADQLGGAFATAYDNLVLTSSASFSMFSDFWIGDGQQHAFWTKDEALAYWTRYAEHFGVMDRIRFNARVTEVTPVADGGWSIRLQSGDAMTCRRLALAIGNNSVPRFPPWRSELTAVDVFHSKQYRNGQPFAGKRVLVVGGGESASDVALEISQVAEQCWVSLRGAAGWVIPRRSGEHASDASTHRGVWDLPRGYGPTLSRLLIEVERRQNDPVRDAVVELNLMNKAKYGIWGTFGTKTLSLPMAMAHHSCRVVGEIAQVEDGGGTLITAAGDRLEQLDAVVFCTGFENYVSFMPPALQRCDPRALFKHMIHPSHRDDLAWIGWARPGFGSQFPIMEMQARYLALLWTGQLRLPEPAATERLTAADRAACLEQFEDNAHRVRSLVDYHRFMDGMATLIGCEPPLRRYLIRYPKLWMRLMYGPTQATQFRLRGPGSKVALAHELLMKLPVSEMNHVVRYGLKGQLRYALGARMPRWLAGPYHAWNAPQGGRWRELLDR